jgi:xylulokinase
MADTRCVEAEHPIYTIARPRDDDVIISHDLGTTGDKATLVDHDGRVVGAATVHYATDFGPGGKAEQNPHDWWNALCKATRQLLTERAVEPGDIDALSFSGQMMGVVPLDRHGAVVRPAIIWADTRSTAECEALVERIGMQQGYRITGHRLNPTYSLSKMMWLKANEPANFARVSTVLQAKDYLAYRLTGVQATDPSDASSTNAFDQQSGTWSNRLIEASGVSRNVFPEVVPSTTIVGTVSAEAASATGLHAGTPVVLGGGDGPMAALGAGITGAGSGAYAYLGSSSWVSIAAEAPLHDPQMRSMTFNHVIPGRFVPTAPKQAGGAALQWIVEVRGSGSHGRPDEGGDYDVLLAEARDAEAAADGLYFLPHLLGERSPYWNPRARAVFAGLARHHGRGHMTRAVLEGVAFNLYSGLRAFAENGRSVTEIDVIGGAAKAELLLEVFANVWGATVTRRNLVDEATALGAAIVGGVAVGVFDDFSVANRLTATTLQIHSDQAAHERYLHGHDIFSDAYRRLEPWFESL